MAEMNSEVEYKSQMSLLSKVVSSMVPFARTLTLSSCGRTRRYSD